MTRQAERVFRSKCRFEVSPRYELFYSLGVLTDPNARIHRTWRKSAGAMLGSAFDTRFAEVGRSWEVWPVLAALMPGSLSSPTFEEIMEALRRPPIASFQRKILRGLIHAESVVEAILRDGTPLRTAVSRIRKADREWTSHIGLFPYDRKSPLVLALEQLISDPTSFRGAIVELLEIYWLRVFKATWQRMLPQLSQSLEAKERLFHSCSFTEFSKQALLRIEVVEGRNEIRAIRGGYRLRFQEINACHFLPSAFNDRRFWSAFQDDGEDKTTVYFPYFDPTITLDLQVASNPAQTTDPVLDPALIFKALGDSTRFAIAAILARAPTSSVELAKTLSVSKPTISHHVHLLREAGLLDEKYVSGTVELQLKRATIERLSGLTIAKLFDAEEPLHLVRTRGGAVS